jgi:Asp/Glu/hydantoin racemase
MTKTLTFLHTSPVHVATFDRLLAELDPRIPVRHIVDETLLAEARAAGANTPQLARRIARTIGEAIERDAAVVVCTCSTIGGSVEQLREQTSAPVMRIDRAMAERAVALGVRTVVVAALASTLEPTSALLREAALRQGKTIAIVEAVSATAWSRFEAGDQAGYLADIAATLRRAAPAGDVIVLAQASMAQAAELCPELTIPILSSPRLGAEAAIAAYHAAA